DQGQLFDIGVEDQHHQEQRRGEADVAGRDDGHGQREQNQDRLPQRLAPVERVGGDDGHHRYRRRQREQDAAEDERQEAGIRGEAAPQRQVERADGAEQADRREQAGEDGV